MLSYIYQIAQKFERSHLYRPNVLYLNEEHFRYLKREFTAPEDIETMMKWLGMNIIISQDIVHPHVARISIDSIWKQQTPVQPSSSTSKQINRANKRLRADESLS